MTYPNGLTYTFRERDDFPGHHVVSYHHLMRSTNPRRHWFWHAYFWISHNCSYVVWLIYSYTLPNNRSTEGHRHDITEHIYIFSLSRSVSDSSSFRTNHKEWIATKEMTKSFSFGCVHSFENYFMCFSVFTASDVFHNNKCRLNREIIIYLIATLEC